jgi:hypothetical protein
MPNEEQHVLDYLNSVSSGVQKFISDAGQYAADHLGAPIDKGMDKSVDLVRGGINSVLTGLGLGKKAIPPPVTIVHKGFFERSQDWMLRHRALTAATLAFLGTGAIGTFLFYSHHLSRRRIRKAKKSKNGARKEAVVVAGNPTTPMIRSIVNDLDKRGFVVYVIVTSLEEKLAVEREGKPDVMPLSLELSDVRKPVLSLPLLTITVGTSTLHGSNIQRHPFNAYPSISWSFSPLH